MTTEGSAILAPPASSKPTSVRGIRENDSTSFVGMSALSATFIGFLSYGRDPDVLTTVLASGFTFIATWVALYVLHIAMKITVFVVKMLLPIAVLLAVGCISDWQWAEATVDWLSYLASKGAEMADKLLVHWRQL